MLFPPSRQLAGNGRENEDKGNDGKDKQEEKLQANGSQHASISLTPVALPVASSPFLKESWSLGNGNAPGPWGPALRLNLTKLT
jgi:hypothetical protein